MWPLIALSGYLLAVIGSAIIVYKPIRRVMGIDFPAAHADEPEPETLLVVLTVVGGTAFMWPLTIPLYWACRFIPAQVD